MKTYRYLHSILVQFRSLSRPARLFMLVILCDGLFFSGWNLFFNLFILAKGFDRETLGLVTAAPSVAGLLLGVPMGLLSDRLGRKPAMFIGFVGSSAFIVVQLFVNSPAVIVILGFLWGALAQLYMLSQAPFMMNTSDEKSRDFLFSVSFGMFPLASALGNLLAGQLPAMFGGLLGTAADSAPAYQATLLVSVLLSQVAMIPLMLIREPAAKAGEQPLAKTKSPSQPLWKVLTRPLSLQLALPNLLIGFGAATLIPYMNVFFAEQHHMDDGTLGLLFSLAALLTGLGCIIGPRLVGNLGGKVRAVVIGQAISLIFLLFIGFSPWPWLAVIGFLVRGALMNMVAPLFDAYAMERTPENEQGAVNSLRGLAWNLGWAIGPYISGMVQESHGFAPLFITTAILYAVASSVTWMLFRPRPKENNLQLNIEPSTLNA